MKFYYAEAVGFRLTAPRNGFFFLLVIFILSLNQHMFWHIDGHTCWLLGVFLNIIPIYDSIDTLYSLPQTTKLYYPNIKERQGWADYASPYHHGDTSSRISSYCHVRVRLTIFHVCIPGCKSILAVQQRLTESGRRDDHSVWVRDEKYVTSASEFQVRLYLAFQPYILSLQRKHPCRCAHVLPSLSLARVSSQESNGTTGTLQNERVSWTYVNMNKLTTVLRTIP